MTPLRWLAVALCAAFGVTGCVGGTDGYRQSLASSAVMLKGSADTFQRGDLAYQQHLEARVDAAAAIKTYRTAVQPKILKGFVDAGAALSVANATVPLVDAGKVKKTELDAEVARAVELLKALESALAAITMPATTVGGAP